MSLPAASRIVVLVGAGPGLGFSLAKTFAAAGHPVAMAARSLDTLKSLSQEINESLPKSNRAIVQPFAVDASSSSSLAELFSNILRTWPEAQIGTGIWNVNAGFGMRPFLEWTESQVREALDGQVTGAFTFSQHAIKAIQSHGQGGALLFTGASASLKGSSGFSGFSAAKSGLRALSQSLAREFQPQGIHVSHIIVDGLINTPKIVQMMGPPKDVHSRLEPDQIAHEYLHLARQHPSVWTHELDLRPAKEKF